MSETGLLPAYLIVGTDGVKRDHAVSRMKARLEKSGMVEFNLDERDMTKDPDIESIIGSLNTFPMGSEFRLVILDGCSKLAKSVSEPLVEYLASPSPTTVCLIIADSLAKNTRLYKAIAKIDKKAVIDCSGTKRWELPRRVQQMATQHGKSITTAAAEELVSRSGENTRMLDNDLAKLAQMVEVPQIELADVERWIVRTAEVQPWDFLNAVSARDMRRSLELFNLLPAKSYVWTYTLLCGRIRELIVAKALDARGQGRELAATLKLQSWAGQESPDLGTSLFDGRARCRARGRGRCGARTEGFGRFSDRAFALDYEHLEKIVMIPAYLTNSFYPFEGERAIVGACMTSPCLRGVIHFLQGTRKELQKWQTSSLRRSVSAPMRQLACVTRLSSPSSRR